MNPCWRCGYQFRDPEDRTLHDCVGDAKLSEATARWRALTKTIPPAWLAVILLGVWTTAIGFHVIGGGYAEQQEGLRDYYSRNTTTWTTGQLHGSGGVEARTVENDWRPSWVQLHLGGVLSSWSGLALMLVTLYAGSRAFALKLPPTQPTPPWLSGLLKAFLPIWGVLCGLVLVLTYTATR